MIYHFTYMLGLLTPSAVFPHWFQFKLNPERRTCGAPRFPIGKSIPPHVPIGHRRQMLAKRNLFHCHELRGVTDMLYKSSLFPPSSRWVSYTLMVPHAGRGLPTSVHLSRTAFCLFLQPVIPPYPYALLLVYMLCRPFTSGSIHPVPVFACLPSVGSSSAPQAFRTKNASVRTTQRPLHKRTNP